MLCNLVFENIKVSDASDSVIRFLRSTYDHIDIRNAEIEIEEDTLRDEVGEILKEYIDEHVREYCYHNNAIPSSEAKHVKFSLDDFDCNVSIDL